MCRFHTMCFTNFVSFSLILLVIFNLDLNAQQPNVKPEINATELIRFAQQKNIKWIKEKRKADSLAIVLNIPAFYTEENGRVVILQYLNDKKRPTYYATDNLSNAATISVDDLWENTNEYPALTGENIEINLWDGGTVLSTHQEFQNELGSRIVMRDIALPLSNHSTHIAGTMIATGVNPEARGMAEKAKIKGWDLNDDLAEMASAAADGILVSNHSYGPLCGWYYNTNNESWYWYGDPEISATEDYEFGFYNQVSADLDYIAQNAPNYLIVKSAGNDRNDAPTTSFNHYVWDEKWVLVNVEREPDGGLDGYDCLSPMAVAKNILTVGAVDDAGAMTTFSAFGPTDDGRIKPDVVADGYDVFSSVSTSNNSYGVYNGTSMSTASASGSIALLSQLQNSLRPGVKLLSSTLKGLLIHSASDLGNTGPDYHYGWGLLNIKNAADLIYTNSNNQGKNIYEGVLTEGEEINIPISTSTSFPFLKVTLSWTDPAGQPSSPSLNSRTKKLVNDLDLKIENKVNLQSFLPWNMDVENPSAVASRGVNHTDNVEQVYLTNPGDNEFNIRISHSGTLTGGAQIFSLIISGIETQSNVFPPQNLRYSINESSILLTWDAPVSGTPNKYKIYRNGVCINETKTNSFSDNTFAFDTKYTYYTTAVYIINNQEIESLGTNQITVFPQSLRSLPFLEDFEEDPTEVTIKNNEAGWQWGNSESLNCYYLDFSDNFTKFIAADSYSAGEALHVSDVAVSAPLRLGDYKNIILSFDYLLKTGIYDAIDELHVVYKLQYENEWHDFLKLESSFNWKHKSIELPEEICINGTQIGFYFDDFYQWGMGAGLDNILITGEKELRSLDFTISDLIAPVSSCSLTDSEKLSVLVKNVGEQTALPGDSIIFQATVPSNEVFNELLILTESLYSNETFIYQFKNDVDLSNTGNYFLSFYLSNSLDKNISNNSFEKVIEVYGYPEVHILNTDLTFCENEDSVLIEVLPPGGILLGTGISGMYFDPITAGVGTHAITYSVTDEYGCQASTTKDFVVNPLPTPAILNEDLTFCENEDPVLIEVSPPDGTLFGSGVSGLYFDPAAAGEGTHAITYSVTDEFGCQASTTEDFVVKPVPQPAILNDDLIFCENEDPVLIEVLPPGGTLLGTGISGMYFDPTTAGVGTHVITYSVTDENDCQASVTEDFIVKPIPQPAILNDDLIFCENEVPVLIEVSPPEGMLSGTGISGLYFDPATAGEGTHAITYSVTDGFGCQATTTEDFVVNPLPTPAILNEDLIFCENEDPVLIEVSPPDGTLFGTGVSGLYFDPAAAGEGTHAITYSLTDEYGCQASTTEDIIVKPLPQPAILNEDIVFLENDSPAFIQVTPSGGTLSGTGITDMYFNPDTAGIGTHTITYSIIDENGCMAQSTLEFTVIEFTQTIILNTEVDFCENDPGVLINVYPLGGILHGDGIVEKYFYPNLAGVGAHTIIYRVVNDDGFESSDSVEFFVHEIPEPQILNTNLIFCENEDPVLIEVSLPEGTLFGTGVSGLYFDPAAASEGTHAITYSVTDEFGCQASITEDFVVKPLPQPAILNENIVFLENDLPVLVQVTPSGGRLSGTGITDTYFDPAAAGLGTHTITYSFIDEYGCMAQTTTEFTVIVFTQTKILNTDLDFCENDQGVLINVYPPGGLLLGDGIVEKYFYPNLAGTGTHKIIYKVVNDIGFESSDSVEFFVHEIPKPQILNNDLIFCENEQPVLIEVSPSGGVLSGNGIVGAYFVPETVGEGTYPITYTIINNYGCEECVTSEILILKNAEINLGPDLTIGVDDTIEIEPTGDAFSYEWYDGSTDKNKTIFAKDLGIGNFNIWVIASNSDFCSVADSLLLTIDFTDSLNQKYDFTQAKVYPNPFREGFVLDFKDFDIIKEIGLYGFDGQIFIQNKPSTFPYFNVSYLTTGTYLLYIKTNRQSIIIKLIKL